MKNQGHHKAEYSLTWNIMSGNILFIGQDTRYVSFYNHFELKYLVKSCAYALKGLVEFTWLYNSSNA